MQELNAKFIELFGKGEEPQRFFCPGRVNLIGEHIDYLGGSVMPTAISLGITALARPNNSRLVNIHSTDFADSATFDLDGLPNSKQGNWGDFPLGVMLHLRRDGIDLRGCDILIDSTLPKGSGLSSSAAIEVLLYYLLYLTNAGKEPDRAQMAVDCQRIENEFIGVNCGIMDQFAVANGRADHAMALNCQTLECEYVPLKLGEYSLVIINTNKPRTLAESAYNQRRKECDEALKVIQNHRKITSLIEATADDLNYLENPILKKRVRHAFSEQNRVQNSVETLRNNDLKKFGELMTGSHISLRDDYEVSCAELDLIVGTLTSSSSCLGARMTGAGFGGCAIALIESKTVETVWQNLKQTYLRQFGFEPSLHICQPSDGVHSITS